MTTDAELAAKVTARWREWSESSMQGGAAARHARELYGILQGELKELAAAVVRDPRVVDHIGGKVVRDKVRDIIAAQRREEPQ